MKTIPFLSFSSMHQETKAKIYKAFTDVFESNSFILGNQVKLFEQSYAAFNQSDYCIGTGNGLDALTISLRALGIGPGDEVIVPANTYIASLLSISSVGAKPVLVEPRKDTYNIDPDLIEAVITPETKAVMPVHLYGQACEMDKISVIAARHGLFMIEDNAQAQGATYNGKLTGTFGNINATSFYPGKNLGALGDAGAITTNNQNLYSKALSLRNYGSQVKYFNEVKGYNSRLDEVQAAVLTVKLEHLKSWNGERKKIADAYNSLLAKVESIVLPKIAPDATSVFHLYVIRTKKRNELQAHLSKKGIGTVIHYPLPPHLQRAYSDLGYTKGDFPVSEEIADTCLSLPVYPGLTKDDIHYISETVSSFFNE